MLCFAEKRVSQSNYYNKIDSNLINSSPFLRFKRNPRKKLPAYNFGLVVVVEQLFHCFIRFVLHFFRMFCCFCDVMACDETSPPIPVQNTNKQQKNGNITLPQVQKMYYNFIARRRSHSGLCMQITVGCVTHTQTETCACFSFIVAEMISTQKKNSHVLSDFFYLLRDKFVENCLICAVVPLLKDKKRHEITFVR